MPPRFDCLGFPIDDVSMEDALAWARRARGEPRPRQIITANPVILMAAGAHPGLAAALRAADLVVPDSFGVVWAGRRTGRPVSRVPGIDLMDRLCAAAAIDGARVGLLGAGPGVAEEAAAALRKRHTGLSVVFLQDGFFSPAEEEGVLARARAAAPDFLFVALDTPRQDDWIHRRLNVLGARVLMGVGGSFDVLSGRLRRAPEWMRRWGLEWLYRLRQEPHRWRRLGALPRFVLRVLKNT